LVSFVSHHCCVKLRFIPSVNVQCSIRNHSFPSTWMSVYIVALQSPYSHEVQQDTQVSPQVTAGYGPPPVRHQYGGPAAGVPQHQQAGSSPSHAGQQMPVPPAHRPVYVSTVPSAMPPVQPAPVSYSQPAVSPLNVSHCLC